MRKFALTAMTLLAVLVLVPVVAEAADLSEVKDMLGQLSSAMETFTAAVDKAASSAEVIGAIDTFSAVMQGLGPKMQALEEKYPELKSDEPPAELAEPAARLEKAGEGLVGAMMKIMTAYGQDPQVSAALEKLGGAMAPASGSEEVVVEEVEVETAN